MHWIKQFQLFLFDFDGLLVDTEYLHYQAYIEMCARRGFQLNWSYPRYSNAAHHDSNALRDQIYAEFPDLNLQEPDWSVLYEEKREILHSLLERGIVPLIPGVANLLIALQKENIRRCVVTHSSIQLVNRIRNQNPLLNTIPHWITREDYFLPKPHPECYQYAIKKLGQPNDQIIGFEDSPRGLNALLGTIATPVLVCPPNSGYLNETLRAYPQVRHYPDFNAIQDDNAPIAINQSLL
ncbi:MAG: HAD family phosphatase [Parachlamydiaceae bacterium]|nr:HAD family phosphatase [Parachlamydiaceae bacterium]